MGTCLSKKPSSSSSSSPSGAPSATETATATATAKLPDPAPAPALVEIDLNKNKPKKKEEEDESLVVKKEIFVIKHRKSQDRDHRQQKAADTTSTHTSSSASEAVAPTVAAAGVRTSSCTKEEVDAILIQCGRLSRSSSGNLPSSASCDSHHRSTTAGTGTPRKYSGSKRSYDFDHDVIATTTAADDDKKKRGNDNDSCDRKSRPISSSSDHGGRRRRTPSREREERQQQQRSGSSSRERRVSRSPGRRSETTTPTPPSGTGTARPGKMVSVPATVSSSLVMDKSNNVEPAATTSNAVKRISVKRNAGAASPRSQSPARTNAKVSNNENQQQPSFSRSSSRKAEQSPCRRNPLSEIDNNSLANPQLPCSNNNGSNRVHNTKGKEVVGDGTAIKESSNILNQQAPMHKPNVEINSNKVVVQGTNQKPSSRGTLENKVVAVNCIAKEQQQVLEQAQMTTTVVASGGAESLKPQKLTRSRSSRRSYDLDLNPETLLNPNTSYTTLLLEDIQNFHQKNTTTTFSLPPCVTKACSILDAVADLNSTTSSNPSCAFSEGRKGPTMDQSKMNEYIFSSGTNLVGKKRSEVKDPFVESEVVVSDDLMEPSFHKYVTVRRGGALGEADLEDQESSGSNSFVGSGGGQQHWGISSSSWEPNSSDSKDCWTSRSNTTREEEQSRLDFQRCFPSESACNVDEARRGCSGRKRESDQQTGIGRFRIGDGRALHSIPTVATAAST